MVVDWSPVGGTVVVLGGLGLAFGLGLAYVARRFHVHEDPRIGEVHNLLPRIDCGACGFAGCRAYAEAVVKGRAGPGECVPGGADTAKAVAAYLGVEAQVKERLVAVLRCNGRRVADRFEAVGIEECRAAVLLHGGQKACPYGCLGFGDCARVCPVDAIIMEGGFPRVIEARCIACGACVRACPNGLFALLPAAKRVHVLCSSHARGAEVRKVCEVGCIACMRCEKVCPTGAAKVEDFLARIDPQTCTHCGQCVEACPMKTIRDFRSPRRPQDLPVSPASAGV